ncbi:MAG: aminotransferase class IV [Candidatus Omnitrophica bacterium]|nr:aminotransferase class IV [Candidatus Omnitrophota bacterium]
MLIAYINGKFVPLDKAKVSVLDRGFLYGDGVFETMRAHNGVVFGLEKHVARLFKSLKTFRINLKVTPPKIKKIVYELLNKNKLSVTHEKDAYIKIIVTRGTSRGLLMPSGSVRATIAIYALPQKQIPRSVYEKGMRLGVSKSVYNEKSPTSGHKTLNYLQYIMHRYDAKRKNLDEVILLNINGFVSEASSSNIFLIKEKRIITPCLKSGCLPGIIRAEVIRLSKRFLKKKVKEIFVKKQALLKADEVFLTNSTVGIMPVVEINGRTIGNGKPGPITKKLKELLKSER